jgi:hypothetical protein
MPFAHARPVIDQAIPRVPVCAVEFLGRTDMLVESLACGDKIVTQAGIATENAIAQAAMALKPGYQCTQQGQLANVQLDMLALLPLQASVQAIEQQYQGGQGSGEQEW